MFTRLGKECKERLESYIQKSSPLEHKGKLSRLLSVNLYFFQFYFRNSVEGVKTRRKRRSLSKPYPVRGFEKWK